VASEYFPIDEAHPTRAEDLYGLSNWVGDQIADGFARRCTMQIASIRQYRMVGPERMAWLAAHPQRDLRPLSSVDQRIQQN
jgi:UDP-glucose 4-epimerase